MGAPSKLEASLWSEKPGHTAIKEGIGRVLGAVTHLPILYWKARMFFRGAKDRELLKLTGNRFPAKPKKTHPVFSLKPLPHDVGFRVCPCSSKKPFDGSGDRFIRKGCQLLHTGHIMDRHSYLVEKCFFNIPRSMAWNLRFKGEVPEDCIFRTKRGN